MNQQFNIIAYLALLLFTTSFLVFYGITEDYIVLISVLLQLFFLGLLFSTALKAGKK